MEDSGDLDSGILPGSGLKEGAEGRAAGLGKQVRRQWLFESFVKKSVQGALAFSFVVFVIYLAGSIPDPGFSDSLLFLLLRMLQYISLALCAFSLCAMGFSVRRLVYRLTLRNTLRLGFYFLTGILGAGLAMLNSMILAVAGGHG